MLPTQSIIDQINTHHTNAMKQAKEAVQSAKAAGELLLQVKATLLMELGQTGSNPI